MMSQAKHRVFFGAGCLVLTALAFLVLCAAVSQIAYATNTYGVLCARYESATDPAEIDPGSAYGAYQMSAASAHQCALFMVQSSKKNVVNWGTALLVAYNKDGNETGNYFDIVWRYEAGDSLSKKEKAKLKAVRKKTPTKTIVQPSAAKHLHQQYLYAKKAYYKPALRYWKKVAKGFKAASYTVALRNVLFSCALQHGSYGSAYNIFKPALKHIGGYKKSLSEKKLIKAIYAERGRLKKKKKSYMTPFYRIKKKDPVASAYGLASKLKGKYLLHFYSSASSVQASLYVRFNINERKSALAMFAANACQTQR